jgi:hypothetical protein
VSARGTVGRTLSTGGHSVPLAGHNGSLSGHVIKAAGTGMDSPRVCRALVEVRLRITSLTLSIFRLPRYSTLKIRAEADRKSPETSEKFYMIKRKLSGVSARSNYTDRATAACRRN